MSESNGRIQLSLERDERELDLTNEDGSIETYVLVEFDGKNRDQYLTNLVGRTSGEVGKASIKSFDGLQSNLIRRCMFKLTPAGGRENVGETTIQSWPAKVQEKLYDICRELCGLDETAEVTAGND